MLFSTHLCIYPCIYGVYDIITLSFLFIRFATLLHQCLGAIKKGSKKASTKEVALASHAIGNYFVNFFVRHIFFFYLNF